jgi:integrase
MQLQWRSTLDRACAAFGVIGVAELDTDALVKFLAPICEKTPETGSRIRGRIESVLDWATASKLRQGDNPARWNGNLEHLLKKRGKAKHHEAMPFADVPAFMGELRMRDSISARALETTILTACRTSEVIGARWDEIDLGAKVWTVPAERMKKGRLHRVPLTPRLVAILKAMPRDSEFVFHGADPAKPLSNMAMLELLKGMTGRLHHTRFPLGLQRLGARPHGISARRCGAGPSARH